MARVKRGVTAHQRHKRLLEAAEGRRGTRSRLVKPAREALLHAMAYAYVGRKQRKRQMRALWIVRLNAAARQNGLTYGRLVNGLKTAGVALDRKVLADIAVRDAATFARIAEVAQPSLTAVPGAPISWTWTDDLRDALSALRWPALAAIAGADRRPSPGRGARSAMLGRKGELKTLLGGIGALPAEDRPRVGALGNRGSRGAGGRPRTPAALELDAAALEARLARESRRRHAARPPARRGSLHPLIETNREIARIFGQFGFVVFEGPEVETDELNFQALNIPPDHPARDLWDTLYTATTARRLPPAHPHVAGPDPRHAAGQRRPSAP